MYTYFIRTKVNDLVKIGKSVNPQTRIKQIQGQATFLELEFLHIIEGNWESLFHSHFAKYRTSGEWFDIPGICPEMIDEFISDKNPSIPGKKQSVAVKKEPVDEEEEEAKIIFNTLLKSLIIYFDMRSLREWLKSHWPDHEFEIPEDFVDLDTVFFQTKKCTLVFKRGQDPIYLWMSPETKLTYHLIIFETSKSNTVRQVSCQVYEEADSEDTTENQKIK